MDHHPARRTQGRAVVTGAFSYIGAAVAGELLRRGWQVHTLTRRQPPPGASTITTAPLTFDRRHLIDELARADLFVNTFWIRHPHGATDFAHAVRASQLLLDAAGEAAVGRLVHVSVSNPERGRGLGYYDGKARVEAAVRACGLSHAIVRPTLVVGPGDVLTGNIAWLLRRFVVFPLPLGGGGQLQPVTLGDCARIIADAAEADDDRCVDAAGPDTLDFGSYVRLVADACGLRRLMPSVPNAVALSLLRLLGLVLRDVVLTREELLGLQRNLLVSHSPALGHESVPAWLRRHGAVLGRRYVNDLERHFGDGARQPLASPAAPVS